MSIKVMTAVFETNLPPTEKIVALKLADHAWDDGTHVFPSAASVATGCSLSERQVWRVIKALLAKGVIVLEKSGGGRASNVYYFPLDDRGSIAPRSTDNLTYPSPSSADADVIAPMTSEDRSTDTGVIGIKRNIIEPSVGPPADDPTPPPSKPEKTYAPEVYELNNHLCQLIDHNGSRVPKGGESDMDKLLRIDKRPPAEVKAVIDWCQGDPFWRSNILSAGKLRKKYDTLRLQAIAKGVYLPATIDTTTLAKAKAWDEWDRSWPRNVPEPPFPRPTSQNGNLLDGDGREYYIDPMDFKRRYVDDE